VSIRFDSYYCALGLTKMSHFFKYLSNEIQVLNSFWGTECVLKNLLQQNLEDLNRAFCYETIQKIRSGDIFAGSFRFDVVCAGPVSRAAVLNLLTPTESLLEAADPYAISTI
jgi:hypothetical protein